MKYYADAKKIYDNLKTRKNVNYAAILFNMADIYKTKGQKAQAGIHYREASRYYLEAGHKKYADAAMREARALE